MCSPHLRSAANLNCTRRRYAQRIALEIHLVGDGTGRPRTEAGRWHGFGRIRFMRRHTRTGAQQQNTGDERGRLPKKALSYTKTGIVRTLRHCCVFVTRPIVRPAPKWRVGFGDSMAIELEPPTISERFGTHLATCFMVAVRGRPKGLPVSPLPGSPTRVRLPPSRLATIE